MYCARLTETCHGTCILLLSRCSDCLIIVLLICTSLWIKASAKLLNVNLNVNEEIDMSVRIYIYIYIYIYHFMYIVQ